MGTSQRLSVATVDYHTAGEPFRIVSGGVPPLRGATVLDKREWAAHHLDHVRRLLVNEPRGHADMYGGFVTEPDDPDGDLGVVFFHNAGYSTACGHGTIALATWALTSGVIPTDDGQRTLHIDVPSGRVRAVASVSDGRVASVRFVNVPSFVEARDLVVTVEGRTLRVDVAFGGAFYASVAAADLGLSVDATDLPALIAAGRAVKRAIEKDRDIVHPDEPRLRDVYGVIFHEELAERHQRNVTVFADGEVDRSPCGSGTSARLALLADAGALAAGDELVHDSIVGSRFVGRVLEEVAAAGRTAWVTEVEGRAALTGYHTFVLEPDDEVGLGFLLR